MNVGTGRQITVSKAHQCKARNRQVEKKLLTRLNLFGYLLRNFLILHSNSVGFWYFHTMPLAVILKTEMSHLEEQIIDYL